MLSLFLTNLLFPKVLNSWKMIEKLSLPFFGISSLNIKRRNFPDMEEGSNQFSKQISLQFLTETASRIFLKLLWETVAPMFNVLSFYTECYLQKFTLVIFSLAQRIIQRTILSSKKKQNFIQISLMENLSVYSVLNHILLNTLDMKF